MIQEASRILITGGSQGIGRAVARHFVERGHKIFLLDVNSDGVKHTAEVHLKDHAERVKWAACDLSDVAAVRATVKSAAEFFGGRIDFLINNAGISAPTWKDGKTMEDEETFDAWKMYMDVNLTGNFAMSQAVIPYMKVGHHVDKQALPDSQVAHAGPCIVNVSSFRAAISDANQEGYAASKAGLIGLTTAMAISLQQFGIRCNAVSPGRVKATHESKDGDSNGASWENEDNDIEKHPTNRAGRPEDIAEAIEYMLGAGFTNGENLTVDGGVNKVK